MERVAAAFSAVPHPGDDALTDSTYGEEPAALVEEFRGRTDWRDLDAAFLDQAPDGWASALSFFSDAALRFYLPAYLLADLRDELRNVSAELRLCAFLTPQSEGERIAKVWGGGTMGERARRCFDALDDAQAAVVVDYLLWKLDRLGFEDPTITQALDHYWRPRVGR